MPGVTTIQTVGLITPTCLGISAIRALPGTIMLTPQGISLHQLGQAEPMMETHQCLMLVPHQAVQMEAQQEEANTKVAAAKAAPATSQKQQKKQAAAAAAAARKNGSD